ncbi:MAG: hypothetical protein JO154_12050 [Chitinophaga sp.]|uniref:hypothetical protein n=1 Tax=Chitinophaga sp. TaxID=1869181 RepID=UPI0025BD0A3A|nr:hypothetical protein [Chitinophaga sp.]MBV8253332.1 hypothetical protein [Chitinophaga sp.]
MRKKKNIRRKLVTKHVIDISSFKKEDFSATIEALKRDAAATGVRLTDKDIAEKIGLVTAAFDTYMANNDKAPEEIFDVLRGAYPDILKYKVYKIETFDSHPDPYTEMEPEDLED